MVRMFVRHTVNDFATWKTAYNRFDEERRGLGFVGDAVFQTAGNPSEVTAWHDFETLEAAQAFASGDRHKAVMAAAGVEGVRKVVDSVTRPNASG